MIVLDGKQLKAMAVSAAHNLENKKQCINELNVFPVPDGDTGNNMSMTMAAAEKELSGVESDSVSQVANRIANALLRGARGNSGVILSLLFRGFAKGTKEERTVSAAQFAAAWKDGVDAAYKAVMKPTEGTILTVAREAADTAEETAALSEDILEVAERMLEKAKATLEKTPEMLPVLKQARVVDAGGMGFVEVLEGFLTVLREGRVIELKAGAAPAASAGTVRTDAISTDFIEFGYCTEFIVLRGNNKNPQKLREYLENIGDSVVLVDDDSIIKVHVHTNNPGSAIERALLYGQLTSVKIDNMREEHRSIFDGEAAPPPAQPETPEAPAPAPAEAEKQYGFVAVAAGDGLTDIFRDLGADNVVSGGQTMNPSTEDILAAVDATPAEIVFVLPNNKNIIMAAEQAIPMTAKRIIVIPTKTIPQGVAAMLAFDPSVSPKDNVAGLTEAIRSVKTGQVTFAARDSVFDGRSIAAGEILGLIENKVVVIGAEVEKTVCDLVGRMAGDGDEILTLYYGAGVTGEDAERLGGKITEMFPDIEVTLVSGGQPVYYYIVSLE